MDTTGAESRRQPFALIAFALVGVLVAVVGIALAVQSNSDAGPTYYGESPATVAQKIGCENVSQVDEASPSDPVHYARVTCRFNGAAIEIDTYKTAADQETAVAAASGFAPENAYYAGGDGWIALDDEFAQSTAQAIVDAFGSGAVRAVN